MDTVDCKNRQSIGHPSIEHPSHYLTAASDIFGRGYTSVPNMATTAVMNPTSIFQNRTPSHPPPPYPHHSSTSNQVHPLSALTSPSHATDSRREEPKEPASQRQSLPSIHEALADPPSTYPAYTSASSHSYTPAYAPSALTPTIRQFPPEPSQYQPQFASTHSHRNSPPQPVQPPSSSFPRSDFTQRNYPDAIRQPSALRAGLPTQTQPNSRAPRPDSDSRYYDRVETSNGYDAPSSEQYRGYPTAPQQSQAVNAYSTHNTSQDAYQQRYAPGADHPDDLASKKEEPGYLRSGFASVLKRNLDYWDEERSVKELNNSAQRLSQMTGEYLSSASRWGNTPNRGNPALVNLNALREEHMKIGHCIEEIQSSFDQQEAIVADQQSREQLGRANSTYDRDDYDGWAGDPKEQGMMMGGPGPNKRRGRAAPPGRCHSCNRAETPEWRRGPDGARTLCNACGLHYAKLTRKGGAKPAHKMDLNSSFRPKSMDES